MKILLFCESFAVMNDLARRIQESVGPPGPGFEARAHADVFRAWLEADAAFMTVESASDVEAARQLRRAFRGIPLVVVGDGPDAALQSMDVGACYYLERDAGISEVAEALWRCGH